MMKSEIYSETLAQNIQIAWDNKGMYALTSDGVYYNPAELRLLCVTPDVPLEKEIHLLKKVFEGELVDYRPRGTAVPAWYRKQRSKP